MNIPTGKLRHFVRVNGTPVTVYRPDPGSSSNYGERQTETELAEKQTLLLTGHQEVRQDTAAGEGQSRQVVGYTDTGANLEVGDEIEYDTVRMEIVAKEGRPSEIDPTIYRYEFRDV